MMKTALSILQSTIRGMGLSPNVPSTLLSLTDPDKVQQLEILYEVCEELRREGPFKQQVQTHEFDTASGTATYPLPGDFYEVVPCTQYNQDTDWRLIGPLTDAEFMAFKEGELYIPTEYVWRIVGFDENSSSTSGRQFEVYPTPGATENLVFQYISGHLFIPPDWAPSTVYASGDYVNVNGRIYLCDTNGTSGSTPPSGTSNNQSDGTTQWDYYSSTYETVLDDSDTCIFDANIVKLGVKAKYQANHAGDPNMVLRSEKAYMDAIESMRFRWEGQTRARGDRRGVTSGSHGPYVQPGSWSFV